MVLGPDTPDTWAEDADATDLHEPDSERPRGWRPGDALTAEALNWLVRDIYAKLGALRQALGYGPGEDDVDIQDVWPGNDLAFSRYGIQADTWDPAAGGSDTYGVVHLSRSGDGSPSVTAPLLFTERVRSAAVLTSRVQAPVGDPATIVDAGDVRAEEIYHPCVPVAMVRIAYDPVSGEVSWDGHHVSSVSGSGTPPNGIVFFVYFDPPEYETGLGAIATFRSDTPDRYVNPPPMVAVTGTYTSPGVGVIVDWPEGEAPDPSGYPDGRTFHVHVAFYRLDSREALWPH